MTRGFILALAVCAVSTPALAYIGPGAGLSLLGALWGLIAAVGLALFFIIAWPVRRMLRKRRARRTGHDAAEAPPRADGSQSPAAGPRGS